VVLVFHLVVKAEERVLKMERLVAAAEVLMEILVVTEETVLLQ
jgi:hypothetical protein